MAFTEVQKISLIKILKITRQALDAQLIRHAAYITEETETAVIAELERWEAGTVKGSVWFTATESNEGFNQGSVNSAASSDPKSNIEILLGMDPNDGLASNEFHYCR